MKRIHIVALSPRTGTTLLAECMVACLNIDGFEAHEASVTRIRTGKEIYLTKRPTELLSVRPRLLLDPHFYVICMMRDPRDVIASRHGKHPEHYWVPLRVWKQRLPAFRRLITHERVLVVRYEDLVTDPDATQQRLRDRLPFLAANHAFSAFHALAAPSGDSLSALGGLRQFDRSSVGNWRNHLPRVAGQLLQHGPLTDELIESGYERDDSWLSVLDGVQPDFTPSHLPDRPRRRWFGRLPRSRLGLPWISAGVVVAARAVGVKVT